MTDWSLSESPLCEDGPARGNDDCCILRPAIGEE
jgi:hypothetical protein